MEKVTGAYTYWNSHEWDQRLWSLVEPIYFEGFPEHGRKPPSLIRRIMERRLGVLHGIHVEDQPLGMALTGWDDQEGFLVLDYLAVKTTARGQGVGLRLVNQIRKWGNGQAGYKGVVVEVEAEDTEENRNRIRFWERCGFALAADYTHSYIWVPEPYYAMVLQEDGKGSPPLKGKELFGSILRFHEQAYKR